MEEILVYAVSWQSEILQGLDRWGGILISSLLNRIKIQTVSCQTIKCFVFSPQASDLEGEIDLTKCYNVSEYQVQRNYGFQIHVRKHNRQKKTVSSAWTSSVTCFYVTDSKRCLHVVGHDVWDTQELDPGSDEERTSRPRPRRDQVTSSLRLQPRGEGYKINVESIQTKWLLVVLVGPQQVF